MILGDSYGMKQVARWLMTSHLGYFVDVTMATVTLAAEHGQTKSGYLMMSQDKDPHIQVIN